MAENSSASSDTDNDNDADTDTGLGDLVGASEVEGGDYANIEANTGLSEAETGGLLDSIAETISDYMDIDISKIGSKEVVTGVLGSILGVGMPGVGMAASALGKANEKQAAEAIQKGNIDEEGNMFGTGLLGETVAINPNGPGGQTEGVGKGDGAGPELENQVTPIEEDEEEEKEPEKQMFSGKSPWELYQESLLQHKTFNVSSPNVIDFSTVPTPVVDSMKSILGDPSFIPVHQDDLASPLAAIVKTGQRSLKGPM